MTFALKSIEASETSFALVAYHMQVSALLQIDNIAISYLCGGV